MLDPKIFCLYINQIVESFTITFWEGLWSISL